jgi:hypothetical protein
VASSLAQVDAGVAVRVVQLSADSLADRWQARESEGGDDTTDRVARSDPDHTLAGGLETSMHAFVASDQALAEAMATVILEFDTKDARDLVLRFLPRMSPVRSVGATNAVLAAAARRKVTDWPGWLSHLDKDVTALADTTDQLTELAVKLWTSATGDSPPSTEALAAAAAEVVRLAPEGLMPLRSGSVAEPVRDALAQDPVSDPAVASLRSALTSADVLAEVGLLDFGVAAHAALQGIGRALSASIPVQPYSGPTVQYLLDSLPTLLDHASEVDELTALRASGVSSTWLSSPARETILLMITRRIRSFDAGDAIPFSPSEISDLISAYGTEAVLGVEAWLACKPEPEDVWLAIKPFTAAELPASVSDALRSYTEPLLPAQRLEVARPALAEALAQMPHQSSFLAVRFSEADETAAADALIDLYSQATNMEQRERVLTLWQQLSPTRAETKRTLIENIFLPLARNSVGGFELAVKYLSLVQGASERTREAVIESLRASAPSDRRKKLERRLRDSGFVRRSILDRIFRSDDVD